MQVWQMNPQGKESSHLDYLTMEHLRGSARRAPEAVQVWEARAKTGDWQALRSHPNPSQIGVGFFLAFGELNVI